MSFSHSVKAVNGDVGWQKWFRRATLASQSPGPVLALLHSFISRYCPNGVPPFAILSACLRDIPGPVCKKEQRQPTRRPTEADSSGRERVSRSAPAGRQGHTLRLVSMHGPVTANPNQARRHSNDERHAAPDALTLTLDLMINTDKKTSKYHKKTMNLIFQSSSTQFKPFP